MTAEDQTRSELHIVDGLGSPETRKVFCGHCGRQPSTISQLTGSTRVCPKCGMGLLLEAPVTVAPARTDPFLVVDGTMAVCAVSREAERLLGLSETEAVNRHVGELLVPADAEATRSRFAALIVAAARGDLPTENIVLRPKNTFGVRYWARIGPCGPPTAAVVVLADAG